MSVRWGRIRAILRINGLDDGSRRLGDHQRAETAVAGLCEPIAVLVRHDPQQFDRGPVMAASRAIGVSRSDDEGSRMTAETTFPAMTCGACSRFGPTVAASYKTPDPLCPLKHRTTSAYERAISILPIDEPGHLRRNKLPVMMHHFEELVGPTSRSRVGRFILVYFLLESHRSGSCFLRSSKCLIRVVVSV